MVIYYYHFKELNSGENRFGDLRAVRTLFSRFDKGVWEWSFHITISIWNSGQTSFGDLRAVLILFSRFGKGVWGQSFPITISIWNRGLPRASGNEHFLLPSQYGKATKPVLVTYGPSRPYFRGFVKGVWGWSFPITISIWNNGETRFGDLRVLPTLFSRFGKGVWGWSSPITISFLVYSAKPVLVTCGPSRLNFRGSARASGDGHF
jgi:hypothetical protein